MLLGKRTKRLWNFKKQGYPPGIDPEAAMKEEARLRAEAAGVFAKNKRGRRKMGVNRGMI